MKDDFVALASTAFLIDPNGTEVKVTKISTPLSVQSARNLLQSNFIRYCPVTNDAGLYVRAGEIKKARGFFKAGGQLFSGPGIYVCASLRSLDVESINCEISWFNPCDARSELATHSFIIETELNATGIATRRIDSYQFEILTIENER